MNHMTSDLRSPESNLVRPTIALAPLLVASILILGCGISFGDEPAKTETFKALESGPAVAGQTVDITLEYAQQYPVDIEVKCDLLSAVQTPTVTPLPTETLAPMEERETPEATLAPIPRVRPTPSNKVLEIFGTTLQRNEDGGPVGEATPVLGTLEHSFRAPAAGDYVVWCYTPDDLNNAIFEELTVSE